MAKWAAGVNRRASPTLMWLAAVALAVLLTVQSFLGSGSWSAGAEAYTLTQSDVTLKTKKSIDQLAAQYKLGEAVVLHGEVSVPTGQTVSLSSAAFKVTGPQSLPLEGITLPLVAGNNQNLTNSLPNGPNNTKLGTLFVDVVFQDVTPDYGGGSSTPGTTPVSGVTFTGTGSTTPSTIPSVGKIRWVIRYTPPIFKFPVPPPAAGPPQTPTEAFTVGSGGGGGAEDLQLNLLFQVPGSPMNQPGDPIRGLAYGFDNNFGTVLFVLVDGGGTNDDPVLLVDAAGGFLWDFIDTDSTSAEGVTVLGSDNDVYILEKGPGTGKKIKKVRDNAPTNDDIGNVGSTITLSNANDTLSGMGLATGMVGVSQEFRTADFTSNAAAQITIRRNQPNGTPNSNILVPSGPTGGGYNALAFADLGQQKFNLGVNGNKMALFDDTGFVHGVKSLLDDNSDALSDVQGLEFANGCLYASDGGDIYKTCNLSTSQQQGPSQNPPRDIAADAGFLYILLENAGNDKVLKTNQQGQTQSEFNLGFSNVEGLTTMAVGQTQFLWFVENDPSQRRVVKRTLSGATPTAPHTWELPFYVGEIGDLIPKDGKLLLAERYSNVFHIFNPTTGGIENTFNTPFNNQTFSFGNEGLALQTVGGNQMWGAKYTALPRFNPTNGSLLGTDFVSPGQPPFNISGLASDGNTLWMTDASTNKVFKATFPGAPAVEHTTIGSYQGILLVVMSPTSLLVSSVQDPFEYTKNTTLTIAITSPENNAGVGDETITIQGTVNDPTVTSLSFGAQLAEVVLFGNPAKDGPSTAGPTADQNQYTKNGLWRFADLQNFQGNLNLPGVIHYGKDAPFGGGYDFSTGAPNTGDLNTAQFLVGEGSTLTFATKWDTEPGFQFDKKIVQFCENNGPCTNLGQVTGDPPTDQFGFPNFNAAPGTVYQFFGNFPGAPTHKMIFVPQFGTGLVNITLPLPETLVGKTGTIRFHFESVDNSGNDGDGWVLDDIMVTGEGGSSDSIPVAADGTWSKEVTLAEGENVITVSGQRSAYTPVLNATASVTVFFDNITPVVTINAVTTPTKVSSQQISGSYVEQTPSVLEVLVKGPAQGAAFKAILTQKSNFTGSFTQFVGLVEGVNTIKVQVTDKSGKVGSDTKTILLDQTGPAVTVMTTLYPVGQVSARSAATGATDQIVVPVAVSDAAAGVQKVLYMASGTTDDTAPQLKTASSVPSAVRDMWGVPSTATHLLITNVPQNLPPSTIALSLKAFDNAGNTTTGAASVKIVASLEQFNVYLMPGYNFFGAPLPCLDTATTNNTCGSGNTFTITELLKQAVPNVATGFDPDSNSNTPVTLNDIIESISAYDGGTSASNFKVFTTDTGTADTLDSLSVLKGYIVKTKDAAFKTSSIEGVGTVPAPIKMTLKVGIKAGELPPSQSVVAGYNLVSPLTERNTAVERFLSGVSVPTRVWVSLLGFENQLTYNANSNQVSVVLGAFTGKFERGSDPVNASNTVVPGSGEWLFLNGTGTLTPTLE